ncbi:MAG: hypothetical protein Ta2A_25210 [Treponemataceae bacterium]|nr:MAG: hypothetical protein Ta2A_25210 [Treponemataceae bacterium]
MDKKSVLILVCMFFVVCYAHSQSADWAKIASPSEIVGDWQGSVGCPMGGMGAENVFVKVTIALHVAPNSEEVTVDMRLDMEELLEYLLTTDDAKQSGITTKDALWEALSSDYDESSGYTTGKYYVRGVMTDTLESFSSDGSQLLLHKAHKKIKLVFDTPFSLTDGSNDGISEIEMDKQ